MNYKATLKLDNGVTGEVKINANNDGDAFVSASKMFSIFKSVEWNIEKMESIFKPKKSIETALDDVERAEWEAKMLDDYYNGEKRSQEEGSEQWRDCEDKLETLYYATESLAEAKKQLQALCEQMK